MCEIINFKSCAWYCEGKLEELKILSCGETICSFCVTSLKIVDKIIHSITKEFNSRFFLM